MPFMRTRQPIPSFQFFQLEWPLMASVATALLFLLFGNTWLNDLSSPLWFTFVLTWLFAVVLFSAFAVVRHAEHLADRLGEPVGTLILTLAVTAIEVMMIAAMMYTGEGNPTLARDTMFAVVMIVLNGMIGLTLLLGGLRYHEQMYNLRGANAYLAVIVPLAVLGMVLPNFTVSSPGPTLSPFQAIFVIVMSIGLYGVFLAIQTTRHRDYFILPGAETATTPAHSYRGGGAKTGSVSYHTWLLVIYLLPLIILSKQFAVPINHAIHALGAPPVFGGFLVAVLILSPESLSAVRATLANQLQRSVNLLLGSVLATISLTIPAVLTIGFVKGESIILGVNGADTILLLLTLGISMLTFASIRTNVLLGMVHLLLFLAYVMLMFER